MGILALGQTTQEQCLDALKEWKSLRDIRDAMLGESLVDDLTLEPSLPRDLVSQLEQATNELVCEKQRLCSLMTQLKSTCSSSAAVDSLSAVSPLQQHPHIEKIGILKSKQQTLSSLGGELRTQLDTLAVSHAAMIGAQSIQSAGELSQLQVDLDSVCLDQLHVDQESIGLIDIISSENTTELESIQANHCEAVKVIKSEIDALRKRLEEKTAQTHFFALDAKTNSDLETADNNLRKSELELSSRRSVLRDYQTQIERIISLRETLESTHTQLLDKTEGFVKIHEQLKEVHCQILKEDDTVRREVAQMNLALQQLEGISVRSDALAAMCQSRIRELSARNDELSRASAEIDSRLRDLRRRRDKILLCIAQSIERQDKGATEFLSIGESS